MRAAFNKKGIVLPPSREMQRLGRGVLILPLLILAGPVNAPVAPKL